MDIYKNKKTGKYYAVTYAFDTYHSIDNSNIIFAEKFTKYMFLNSKIAYRYKRVSLDSELRRLKIKKLNEMGL